MEDIWSTILDFDTKMKVKINIKMGYLSLVQR